MSVSASAVSSAAVSTPRSRSGVNRQAITPVLQFWKAFDLDSKRLVLDTQGNAMKTEKESSLKSRKKLAETTKTFRKLGDPDKISAVGGLLRAYQEEVDNLTKRAKYAENAFFMLYKGLFAAPDPVPSLEAAMDLKVSEIEEQNKKLKRELKEYETEFASLKNQDITIRKLEEQISNFEQEMDNIVHTRVSEQCRALEDQLAAKEGEIAQQRMDYERQLENSRSELRDAFSRMDAMQSDLFAHKQRSGIAKNAFDAEMEMISQEAILTQTLQLENAQLKKQIDDLLSVTGSSSAEFMTAGGERSSGHSLSTLSLSTLSSSEIAEREATILSLRQEVLRLKESLANANAAAASAKETHEEAMEQTKRVAEELTSQLSLRPTMEKYNDVLHQLRVLQQLEYNIVDEEESSSTSSSLMTDVDAVTGGSSSAPSSLSDVEKILVSRVRRLEHSLQQNELLAQQRTTELAQARDGLERKSAVIHEQVVLLRNLEEHVAALESRKNTSLSPNDVGTEILMDAMEDQLTGSVGSEAVAATSAVTGGVGASDNKMLEIVRGQRDRFRERMKELQTEKSRLEELANSYKASVTRLENDNMQLYHKIRYLQSYRGGSGSSSSSASAAANHRVSPSFNNNFGGLEEGSGTGGSDAVEAKYKSMYEEKMNPFVQFNRMESQQRYTNLNTVDKILLNSAKMFLGHRITRNIAFGYILLLHFLVFATLYSFMHGCGISNA